MSDFTHVSPPYEPTHAHHSHLLCWKSIFAGILISILSFMILGSLGAGVLGTAAQNAIESESHGATLATASGLWLGLSAVIALFLGSYFTTRISKTVINKIGAAHGFVIASAFFILLIMQAGSAIGTVSRGIGHLVSGLSQGAASVGANPMVQDTIYQALGNTNLKSDPKTVVEGLTLRLIQGDVESAKAYYTYQTGLGAEEVNLKVAQLKADFERTSKNVGEKAAAVVSGTGWSLFVTFMVGLLAALIGGIVGAHCNVDKPLTLVQEKPSTTRSAIFANQNGSAMPYIIGWLLGVPTTILFLVFMLRSIF